MYKNASHDENSSHTLSKVWFDEALTRIAGGVNSPSRSFHAVGGIPLYMQRAHGAYIWDVAGKRYIDYLAAYGPIILGHGHEAITEAITEAARGGVVYGTPHPYEVVFARLLHQAIPSMEQLRFTNSGTEAVMSTIRLARAYTKRTKIVKFAGCYHGHADAVLVAAGSGAATVGVPDSAGVTAGIATDVLTVPFNDGVALQHVFARWGTEIAAVLIEPIGGNFGIVAPEAGFLESLCTMARHVGALVIYDEVISAFRFHWGGAQTWLPHPERIAPDLTALGKIIGGGVPIGAYGGRAAVMAHVAPLGTMYQAGTHAANPLSIAAGLACVQQLQNSLTYAHMATLGAQLAQGFNTLAHAYGIPLTVLRLGGALSIHFCAPPIRSYADAQRSNPSTYARFFHLMLDEGILFAPSIYEAWFISAAHTQDDIDTTLRSIEKAFARL